MVVIRVKDFDNGPLQNIFLTCPRRGGNIFILYYESCALSVMNPI